MSEIKVSPREQNIVRMLNQRKQQDNQSLFEDVQTPYYWKLSDLVILYPNYFDIKDPISTSVITQINDYTFKHIPKFRNLTPQPIHMLNFKEKYNTFIREENEIKTINGTNQKLSPIVCEYLFGQFEGTEFEQAYFICLNQPIEKIKAVSNLLKFTKIRTQVKRSSEILSSLIKRSTESRIESYSEVWSFLWCTLFKATSMDDLRAKYQIKNYETILNHMQLEPLIYVNGLLQEIIQKIYNRPKPNKQEIKEIISDTLSDSRVDYFEYKYTAPENYTTKNTENTIIDQIEKARVSFLSMYFPISLQQR